MDPQLQGPPWGDRDDYEGSLTETFEELIGLSDNDTEIAVWERGTNGMPFWYWLSLWAVRRYAVCKARERGYDYEGAEVQSFVFGAQATASGGEPTQQTSTDERLVLYTYPNGDWLCFERCLPVFIEGPPALQDHPWSWRQIEDKPAASRFPEPEKPFDRNESMTLEERVAILCDEHKTTLAECGCKDMVQRGGKWVREAYDAFDRPTGDQALAVFACCDCGMPVEPDVDSIKTPAGTWLHLEGCVMPTFGDVKVKDKKKAPEPAVEAMACECPAGDGLHTKDCPYVRHVAQTPGDTLEAWAVRYKACPACTEGQRRLPCSAGGPCGGSRSVKRHEEPALIDEEQAAPADPTRGPVQPCPGCRKLTGRRPLCPACTVAGGNGTSSDHAGDGGDSASQDEVEPLAVMPWDEPETEKKRTVHMVRMFDKASVCGRPEARVNRVEQKTQEVTCKSCLRMAASEIELRTRVSGVTGEPREVLLEDAPTPDNEDDFGRIRLSCHCGRTAVASEEYWPRPVQGIYCDCGDLFVAWPIKLGDAPPAKTADSLEGRPQEGKWPCELCSHLAHHHVGYSDDSPLKCVSCDCPAFMEPGEKKSTVCTLCFHTYAWALGHGVANLCESCAKMNCLVPYEGPAQVERLRNELKAQEKLDAKECDLTEPSLPPCEVEGCDESAAVRFHRKGKGYPIMEACKPHADDSKVRGRRRAFSQL